MKVHVCYALQIILCNSYHWKRAVSAAAYWLDLVGEDENLCFNAVKLFKTKMGCVIVVNNEGNV